VDDNPGSEIEALLLTGADGFLSSVHTLERARRLRRGLAVDSDPVWLGMAQCGWLAMGVPESLGGSGLPVGPAVALATRLGSALLPEPFAECAVAPAALLKHAESAAAVRIAQGLVDGSMRPCIAWQSEPGQLNAPWAARVVREAGAPVLDGSFHGLEASATHWIVPALDGGEPVLLLIDANSATGVLRKEFRYADGSAGASVVLRGLPVDDASLVLLRGDLAGNALEDALDRARLVIAAQLTGMACAALARTILHLEQRKQFDQPLSAFQVLRHRVVDLEIQKRLAIASLQRARASFEQPNGADVRAAYVSAAKARCADAALLVARMGVQLHGAIGYSEEADIGLFLDSALKFASRLGNASLHRGRYQALATGLALHTGQQACA